MVFLRLRVAGCREDGFYLRKQGGPDSSFGMSQIDFTPKPAKKHIPPPPDYAGLVLSSRMAMGAAILFYSLGVLLPVAFFVHQNQTISTQENSFEIGIAYVSTIAGFVVAGGVSHGVSNLLLAVRDIARNSFKS
jgi:hypothetical protein